MGTPLLLLHASSTWEATWLPRKDSEHSVSHGDRGFKEHVGIASAAGRESLGDRQTDRSSQ